MDDFSTERIASMFEEYYQSLLNLDGEDWYKKNRGSIKLDWLRLVYPGE